MQILGIETSCDETAVAIYCHKDGLKAHTLFSQIELHQIYGGVVPELASRDHIVRLLPLISSVLKQANITPAQIDGIAYTKGPGLVGALLVGASLAKSLAYAWQVPSLGVHHLEGHLLAPMLEEKSPKMPFVALLVSGGHTMLIKVSGVGKYQLLGETLDDAAGEAFDKTAKLLDFGYPGGPQIAKAAQMGDPSRFNFPRPMINRPNLDFSFSGLKTYALTTWQECQKQNNASYQTKCDIALAFENAVVDVLAAKCQKALAQTGLKTLVVAGGVSANLALRTKLSNLADVFYPRFEFCTDNGAMIAYAGCLRLMAGMCEDLSIKVQARWNLTDLEAI